MLQLGTPSTIMQKHLLSFRVTLGDTECQNNCIKRHIEHRRWAIGIFGHFEEETKNCKCKQQQHTPFPQRVKICSNYLHVLRDMT